jgi:predicted RNA-binding Zn-ribbon protein involved in translation (DUF1610 family)
METHLRAVAAGEAWCRFLGPIQDSAALSRIFRASDAVVIPGYVGLAVNHAFAHGRPVITCRSAIHSPEIDYIEHDVNGLILPSLPELGVGLLRFAASAELRRSLAAGALKTHDKLDLQRMVEAFDDGVRRAIERGKIVIIGGIEVAFCPKCGGQPCLRLQPNVPVQAHLACSSCGWQAGHIIARSLASWDHDPVAAAAASAWNADVAIGDPHHS